MISTARGSFSVVPMFAWVYLPPRRPTPPPSARQILGVDRVEVLVDHELRADVGRAFLARLGQEDHVAVERGAGALQHQHQHQAGDQVVLVVHGAAAVDVAARQIRAEWTVIDPLLRVDRDDVGVPHHENRPLLAVALDARDEVGAARVLGEHLVRDALLVEHLLHVLHRARLVARRVAGVDADQRLEMLQGLGFDRLPVDRRLRARRGRHAARQQRRDDEDPFHAGILARWRHVQKNRKDRQDRRERFLGDLCVLRGFFRRATRHWSCCV